MRTEMYPRGDVAAILAALYATTADSGERRGFLRAALAFQIPPREIVAGAAAIAQVEAETARPEIRIINQSQRLTG